MPPPSDNRPGPTSISQKPFRIRPDGGDDGLAMEESDDGDEDEEVRQQAGGGCGAVGAEPRAVRIMIRLSSACKGAGHASVIGVRAVVVAAALGVARGEWGPVGGGCWAMTVMLACEGENLRTTHRAIISVQ